MATKGCRDREEEKEDKLGTPLPPTGLGLILMVLCGRMALLPWVLSSGIPRVRWFSADAGAWNVVSPLMAEAMTLRLAFYEARMLNPTLVMFERDNQIVTNPMSGCGECLWELDLIISEIHALIPCFERVLIRPVFREANAVADKIASLSHMLPWASIMTHHELCSLVWKDAIVWPHPNFLLIKINKY